MTTNIYFSSKPLGEVSPSQVQRILRRYDLGELISYEKTPDGTGKQTMFIHASSGKYILKGNISLNNMHLP